MENDVQDLSAYAAVGQDYPVDIIIPQPEGKYKRILLIDHSNKIHIFGNEEEFQSVLVDPRYQHTLWIIRPIIILAIEVLRLRKLMETT